MKNLTRTSVDSNGELQTDEQREQQYLYQERIFDVDHLFKAIQIVTLHNNQDSDTPHILETLARFGSNVATEIKETF